MFVHFINSWFSDCLSPNSIASAVAVFCILSGGPVCSWWYWQYSYSAQQFHRRQADYWVYHLHEVTHFQWLILGEFTKKTDSTDISQGFFLTSGIRKNNCQLSVLIKRSTEFQEVYLLLDVPYLARDIFKKHCRNWESHSGHASNAK